MHMIEARARHADDGGAAPRPMRHAMPRRIFFARTSH
jgi:hypothetical protein